MSLERPVFEPRRSSAGIRPVCVKRRTLVTANVRKDCLVSWAISPVLLLLCVVI